MSMKRGSGGDDHLGVSAMKMKKIKGRRKVREPRFCFKTMSDVDVLDDGLQMEKVWAESCQEHQHPRSYYRCTQDNCRVKKRVERLADDPRMVITTYEGRHIHSPSQDEDDSQASAQLNNFFW
ncbi:putative WRKY transcription factor 13 [Sesamum angolense]|uniref:WRKY transcription factor 13 n=1 Tax=Sesamum angolense TaxID=2727404 RepID=A0AAE1T6F2_9LAMI|nr:putative WRKY transcription factor 13 [Sesamum angolense]